MTDFLLELRSEEVPARMQAKARDDLRRLFAEALDARNQSVSDKTVTYATPRRLALISPHLPVTTQGLQVELKGPRASAPPQALDGFMRKNNLSREQLTQHDGIWFANIDQPGRAMIDVLAEVVPEIIRAFPWPKSMRWGAASASTESLRWVRPLQGIVALFGDDIVPVEVAGVTSGAATLGHRFHHPGVITIGSAHDYVEKLRACHVIVDQDERAALIRTQSAALAAEAGLVLVEDEGLVAENAGLTEWPVPLLGRFDEAFLAVPPQVIQLTARVNQKYFVCRDGEGRLANAFVCTANIDATDGGATIVEGNRKVLAARLSDARFFYETDLKVPLEEQVKKLEKIVFHEKLGTVADKVERVARLARWLVEEGIVNSSPLRGEGDHAQHGGGGAATGGTPAENPLHHAFGAVPLPGNGEELADLAERAARLCKADLVTGMVGEFPELQGLMGGYYALAQGEDRQVAGAIRDHYKPVGQGDEVPIAPVTVAVSLADKLDTLVSFFVIDERPTGSRDPFALRRSALSIISLLLMNRSRILLSEAIKTAIWALRMNAEQWKGRATDLQSDDGLRLALEDYASGSAAARSDVAKLAGELHERGERLLEALHTRYIDHDDDAFDTLRSFVIDRLKVQQREAGVRHDLIDAVFALGGEDDLVRLLARVRALQAFVGTEDGANLLAGYKRAANILKKEGYESLTIRHPGLVPGSTAPQATPPEAPETPEQVRGDEGLSYTPEIAEAALIAALDSAEPAAASAVAGEDFEGAMAALASLRAPIDAFFETVTVNDPDHAKRAARLALLARVRAAVHTVADFSRIEG